MKYFFSCIIALFLSVASNAQKDSLVLYIFLLDECKICKDMTPYLNQMYSAYKQDIAFIGVFPNFSSKKENIKTFTSKYNVAFPVISDYFKTKSKKWKAEVLPEVVLVNISNNNIIYRGAINDLYTKPNKRKQAPNNHYLKNAIDSYLSGNIIQVPQTTPVGCFINFNDL